MPSERPGPELPEVRERIAAAIHGSDYGRTCSSCLKRADAVLDVLNPKQVGRGWCPVHGDAACPEDYMLLSDGQRVAPGYSKHWNEDLRCGRRVPVFTLSTEPGDAGLTVEAAEPCAPASPVGTPSGGTETDGEDRCLVCGRVWPCPDDRRAHR